jgi:hypothetical protein
MNRWPMLIGNSNAAPDALVADPVLLAPTQIVSSIAFASCDTNDQAISGQAAGMAAYLADAKHGISRTHRTSIDPRSSFLKKQAHTC